MPSWIQITLDCSQTDGERVSDCLSECGALSVTYQGRGQEQILEPHPDQTPLWNDVQLTGLFDENTDMAQVKSCLKNSLSEPDFATLKQMILEDRVWERECLQGLEAMKFGRLWVCPSDQPCPEPDQPSIVLDPGLAFGTGTHPTTALCLEWLGEHDLNDQMVIDYGCGSGILAVAAVRLGARHVLAVDHDPQALEATQENAKRNGLEKQITTCLPEAVDSSPVDLLVANILAGPLQSLASTFNSLVKPGGKVVISGLLAEATEKTSLSYERWFETRQSREQQGWMCLSFCKP